MLLKSLRVVHVSTDTLDWSKVWEVSKLGIGSCKSPLVSIKKFRVRKLVIWLSVKGPLKLDFKRLWVSWIKFVRIHCHICVCSCFLDCLSRFWVSIEARVLMISKLCFSTRYQCLSSQSVFSLAESTGSCRRLVPFKGLSADPELLVGSCSHLTYFFLDEISIPEWIIHGFCNIHVCVYL